MKRLIPIVILISLLFSVIGCSKTPRTFKYSYEFTGIFDTVIQIAGYAKNKKAFEEMVEKGQNALEELDALYDIYSNIEGLNNIKTINDMAGVQPVKVDGRILDLIEFAISGYKKTGGLLNIAMGPVLKIWHDYRMEGNYDPRNAKLPSRDTLIEAAQKTDIDKVIVNREESTVFLAEEGMSLDVGAVAKGYAVELAADYLVSLGYTSFLISAGGNVKAVGKPDDGKRNKWGIGLQDPDANPLIPEDNIIDTVYVSNASVVSSGDYQRYYVVEGKRYHHLISPKTLMPADYYKVVTVVAEDSGLADFMSTTLFLLPYEESRQLAELTEGVEVMWIFKDGTIQTTELMKTMLKIAGGATNQ